MKRRTSSIAALGVLLFLLDQLYRVLHPQVNLVRAVLVGLGALALLAPLRWLPRRPFEPWVGALAIFASASGSVVLIEAGLLTSRSPASGAVHLLILAAAFALLDRRRPSASLPFRRARV
jgi:hypothetical protein